MLLVNIFTMELLFTFKDQIQLLHVMLKEFLKGKANGWHGVDTYIQASYRPQNMIIKIPLTLNIGNTIQTNKYAAIQIETSGRIMIRVYGLQNDDVEFGGVQHG